jgi:hypothetical protein
MKGYEEGGRGIRTGSNIKVGKKKMKSTREKTRKGSEGKGIYTFKVTNQHLDAFRLQVHKSA